MPTLVNVTAAGIMMQVALAIIVMLGLFSFRISDVSSEWTDYDNALTGESRNGFGSAHLYGLTILMLIGTICLLLLSADFATVWKPMTHNLTFKGFPSNFSLQWVFITDIVYIGILMICTGGSREGPFSSLCFTFPALAIFLQQPFKAVLWYVTFLAIIFTLTIFPSRRAYGREARFAYWMVSLLCAALTTFIAYVTQPAHL